MRKSLFIIMPISECEDAEKKSSIIIELAREKNWDAKLPSYDPRDPTFDLDVTISKLDESDIVFADLTDSRPSCYYELGLAEAKYCNIILAARTGTEIHQTSLRNQVIYYDSIDEFKKIIVSALNSNS